MLEDVYRSKMPTDRPVTEHNNFYRPLFDVWAEIALAEVKDKKRSTTEEVRKKMLARALLFETR